MWCLVIQPDGFGLDLVLSSNSRGQECLNKVCDKLDIIEVDYFGLQYKKNGTYYWLNLRNLIRHQISCSPEPIRLYFKVKFYVPPHLIQQSSTRHQFYLYIQQNLHSKRLKVTNAAKKAKMIALAAQTELGDYKDDSFDLQLFYSKWIKALDKRHSSSNSSDHSKCSKTSLKHSSVTLSNEEGKSKGSTESNTTFSDSSSSMEHIEHLIDRNVDLYHSIVEWHKKFKGYLSSVAQGVFLKEASEIDDIGVDYFSARFDGETANKCKIGVGTLVVIVSDNNKKLINYTVLEKVRTSTKCFTLKFMDDDCQIKEQKFKLASNKIANALYRLVTEKHVFYSCDTVGDSVASQCFPNLTGMIMSITPSIFKDDPEFGKKFVFDIRRTLRQFYDDVQRTMFRVKTRIGETIDLENCDSVDVRQTMTNNIEDMQEASTSQQNLLDHKFVCRICLDHQSNTAFSPCGHMISCEQCSQKCDICPICRTTIDNKLRVYI